MGQKKKIELLTVNDLSRDTAASLSLCGSRVITDAFPINDRSTWSQFTLGGVITMGGHWYGLTVAHPFFTSAPDTDSDSDTASQDTSFSERVNKDEDESQDTAVGAQRAVPRNETSLHAIYSETWPSLSEGRQIPTTAAFSRSDSSSILSLVGHFNSEASDSTAFHPAIMQTSSN